MKNHGHNKNNSNRFVRLCRLFLFCVGQILVCSFVWCSVYILFFSLPHPHLSPSFCRFDSHFFFRVCVNVISIASISLQFMIILLHGIPHNRVGQINKRSRSPLYEGDRSKETNPKQQKYVIKIIAIKGSTDKKKLHPWFALNRRSQQLYSTIRWT